MYDFETHLIGVPGMRKNRTGISGTFRGLDRQDLIFYDRKPGFPVLVMGLNTSTILKYR